MTTPEVLDRLAELYAKATPGEWASIGHFLEPRTGGSAFADFSDEDDAATVAALHNAFPDLIALARAGLRYRWLKENMGLVPRLDGLGVAFRISGTITPQETSGIDAAIDAAMKED